MNKNNHHCRECDPSPCPYKALLAFCLELAKKEVRQRSIDLDSAAHALEAAQVNLDRFIDDLKKDKP